MSRIRKDYEYNSKLLPYQILKSCEKSQEIPSCKIELKVLQVNLRNFQGVKRNFPSKFKTKIKSKTLPPKSMSSLKSIKQFLHPSFCTKCFTILNFFLI